MKKKFRVKRNEDFQAIISRKQSFACKEFVLYVAKNDFGHARVGISVSKKLGNAVVRNKIKRQVRELCAKVFDFDASMDYVVIVRKGFLDRTFQQNLESLKFVFSRVTKKFIKKENKNETKQS